VEALEAASGGVVIRVFRELVRPPAILTEAEGSADRERRKAREHFTMAPPATPAPGEELGTKGKKRTTFEFKIYKDDGIRAKLEDLFHGKCAYCESYYAGVHPVDVEHWRPKAEVTPEPWEGNERLPGYWFLASDWDNLLPSCIDCNRARSQKDVSDRLGLLGKANRFPIEPGLRRASTKADLESERPLLLNPCRDDPAEHLQCDPADPAIVRARGGSLKGQQSIDVYGLNRAGLAVARRERLTKIRLHLYQLRMLSQLRERSTSALEQRILDDLRDYELRALEAFRRDDEPFAMMSRAVIDEFMTRMYGPRAEAGKTEASGLPPPAPDRSLR
jgi:hypothetical protein